MRSRCSLGRGRSDLQSRRRMARLFPIEITAEDVASMLATMDSQTPYFENGCACFDFDDLGLCATVALNGTEYDAEARQTIEEAISLAPEFYHRLRESFRDDGSDDGRDDQDLSMIEVAQNEISLYFVARNYNASWDATFQRRYCGDWHSAGSPFPASEFRPEWRTETTVSLAQTMDTDRDYTAMPILGDALEDIGCDDGEVLDHCRDSELTHAPGCWVVDLLLGRRPIDWNNR